MNSQLLAIPVRGLANKPRRARIMLGFLQTSACTLARHARFESNDGNSGPFGVVPANLCTM